MSRVARCQNHIWSVAAQVLATGTDVVLELGLLRKSDRAAIKARVELAGHKAVFHFVDADVEVRRARVLRRNAERGATYSFDITPTMFEAMERCFEWPTAEEAL